MQANDDSADYTFCCVCGTTLFETDVDFCFDCEMEMLENDTNFDDVID